MVAVLNGMYILSPAAIDSDCNITAISAGAQSDCVASSNTYTQVVTVTYNDPPTSGNLIVQGQIFPIGTSPQQVMLSGLTADGEAVNVSASFSAESSCSFTQNAVFTAPISCAPSPTCASFTNSTALTIPESGIVTSTINISVSGTLTDVNIKNLEGSHDFLGDLTFELTSPMGTKITLFSGECESDMLGFNISLDSEATSAIECPLNDNQTERPTGDLSAFNGQEAMGDWILTITDGFTGDGGQLTSWTLELCGNVSGGDDCDNPPPASGDIAAATYQTDGLINTGGSIASPNMVLFKAENSITLAPSFMVADGAALDCIIEDCPTSLRDKADTVVRSKSAVSKGNKK